jgi:hypothetical protein
MHDYYVDTNTCFICSFSFCGKVHIGWLAAYSRALFFFIYLFMSQYIL